MSNFAKEHPVPKQRDNRMVWSLAEYFIEHSSGSIPSFSACPLGEDRFRIRRNSPGREVARPVR